MKKALVVDDTKNIRTLLTMCLESEGYQVITADDGKEGLSFIQNEPLDLVFLDIKLPEITGTEVLRRVRESGINTPIIIMTAFATVKNAVECTKLGAVIYLQKPFTAAKLRRILHEIPQTPPASVQEVGFYISKAKQLILEGNLADAFKELQNSLAVNASHGETYKLMARIYEAQGQKKEAERFNRIAGEFEETQSHRV